MSILTILHRVNAKYLDPPHPLVAKTVSLKRSYLTGLAMQAHSDDDLDEEEKKLFLALAQEFEIEQSEAMKILAEAAKPSEKTVAEIRESLMDSKFKYYFILDLQIMAHQDRRVRGVETAVIQEFGKLLCVDREDIQFLTELADAVVEKDLAAKERWVESFFHSLRIHQTATPKDFAHYTNKVD